MSWTNLQNKSYTPYSASPEVCIVQSRSGKCYNGVRVENVSFPLTIPAIQAACCICLSEGEIPSTVFLPVNTLPQLDYWVKEFDMKVIIDSDFPSVETETLYHPVNELSNVRESLKILLDQAVVPLSDFPVSALLFVEDGYFSGVNIEVSDWTKGLCAERVAIAKAYASGHIHFEHLEVHTRKGEVSSPCGACRQVILEHLPYHVIKLHHADGSVSEHMTADLLPFSFKSTTLKQ